MKLHHILIALALVILPLKGATIVGIEVRNRSSEDFTQVNSTVRAEFSSANRGTSAVSTIGNISSFTNQFSWFLGQQALGDISGNTVTTATISYEIFFTVLDPTNSGYFLYAESNLQGWLTGEYDPQNFSSTSIGAGFSDVEVEISREGLYTQAPGLGIGGASIVVNENFLSNNELIFNGGGSSAAIFVGTSSFSARVTIATAGVIALVEAQGEAGLRFGLNPTLNFGFINTPGNDGEEAEMLGHFLTVQMLSLQASEEVPEPSEWLVTGATLGLLAYQRRRRAS